MEKAARLRTRITELEGQVGRLEGERQVHEMQRVALLSKLRDLLGIDDTVGQDEVSRLAEERMKELEAEEQRLCDAAEGKVNEAEALLAKVLAIRNGEAEPDPVTEDVGGLP